MSNQQRSMQSKYHTKRRKFKNKNLLWRELAFKLRDANHKKTFNKIKYQFDTELYLNGKVAVALLKDDNMLNKGLVVISKFRQRNKYMLANYDRKD